MPSLNESDQILKIIQFLKDDEVAQKVCAEHGFDLNWIDFVPIIFGELPVSAKTDHGIIILNKDLLLKSDFKEIASYMLHEFTHYLQQCFGKKATDSSNSSNYLENPYEQEAFQNQIEFLADHKSKEHAEDYVEDLLNHHKVEDHKRNQTEDTLLSKI